MSGLILCGGFPKCATTSLAVYLSGNTKCAVHPDKEPGIYLSGKSDFVTRNIELQKAQISQGKWAVDFTTLYGLSSNREAVINNVKMHSVSDVVKVIVCVREPRSQLESHLNHLLKTEAFNRPDSKDMVTRLKEGVDYNGAVADFSEAFGSNNVYVIRYEDLCNSEESPIVLHQLMEWLDVSSFQKAKFLPSFNRSHESYEYHPSVRRFISALKAVGLTCHINFGVRQRMRKYLGRRVVPPEYKIDVSKFSQELSLDYRSLVTGPALLTKAP